MRLGIIACVETVTPEHLATIDKLCRHIWEFPSTIRYYNVITETSRDDEIKAWSSLYFGCKFLTDSKEKLPRVRSLGNLNTSNNLIASGGLMNVKSPRTSGSSSSPRSNTPSPRVRDSPRLTMSPRKLSTTTISNLELIAKSCDHLIIVGGADQLSVMLKILGDLPLLLIANL